MKRYLKNLIKNNPNVDFGKDLQIEEGVIINIKEGSIGDRTIIRSGARIEGNVVRLGTESYLDHGSWIGGGSCFDSGAYLNAGDWLHMGWNSQINIAKGVDVGDEVGIGIETKVFTHGAYLPVDSGFPVQWAPVKIGSSVWLPNAWVNPGVVIENCVVVGARSLVNINLPFGCFAAGIPVRILKEKVYPKKVRDNYIVSLLADAGPKFETKKRAGKSFLIVVEGTLFDLHSHTIRGMVSIESERMKNQLRRNGIRFRYTAKNGFYVKWEHK